MSPSTCGRVDAIAEEFRSAWPVADCGPMMSASEDVVAAPRLKNRRNFEPIRDLLTSLSVDRCLHGGFLLPDDDDDDDDDSNDDVAVSVALFGVLCAAC